MKSLTCLLVTTLAAAALQPPVISTNQSFAVRNGTQFANSNLDAYEGKILVVMLMTPWCGSCQSNAQAVGDGILDHFNALTRAASLRGKNNNGIEIRSLLLSTEPAAGWDGTNSTFATLNGYQQWGLDATAQRTNPRVMLGYYRGGFPNGINYTDLHDWNDDRRRVVVLNLVRDSASHAFRQIVVNQNAFTADDEESAQAAINAIQPAPVTTSFTQWRSGFSFASGAADANDDPDNDGSNNLLEFFHGTHPLSATSRDAGPALVRQPGSLKLVYRRAKNIGSYTLEHRTSVALASWQVLAPASLSQTTRDLGNVDEITVTLPASSDPARYYQLAVMLPTTP